MDPSARRKLVNRPSMTATVHEESVCFTVDGTFLSLNLSLNPPGLNVLRAVMNDSRAAP
jgi:hypothetical protein